MSKRERSIEKILALSLISLVFLLGLLVIPITKPMTVERAKLDSSIRLEVQNGIDTPNILYTGHWGTNNTDTSEGLALDGSSVYIVGDIYYGLSFGNNGFIAKLDATGNLVWEDIFNTTEDERLKAVEVDNQGDVVVVGHRDNVSTNYDVFVVKYNASGEQLWNNSWDSGFSDDEEAFDIVVDSSDNIYIAGWLSNLTTADYDPFVVKLNSTGDFEWKGTWLNDSADDRFFSLALDGAYLYLAGYTTGFGAGSHDVLLAKYDLSGNLLWNVTWGGSLSDKGEGVAVDASHNVYVTGTTLSFGAGESDAFLAKFSSAGSLIWNITYGTSLKDLGSDLAVDNYGYIHLVGRRAQTTGMIVPYDGTYAIFDSSSNKLWDMTWGTVVGSEDGNDVVTGSNEVYFTGPLWNATNSSNDVVVYGYRVNPSNGGSSIPGFQSSWLLLGLIFLLGIPSMLNKSKKRRIEL